MWGKVPIYKLQIRGEIGKKINHCSKKALGGSKSGTLKIWSKNPTIQPHMHQISLRSIKFKNAHEEGNFY